jgi:hypothetical protein
VEKVKKHIAWIFNTNRYNSKTFKLNLQYKELGSINTKEYEETHNDNEGKKHIAWIFKQIEIILKLFKTNLKHNKTSFSGT